MSTNGTAVWTNSIILDNIYGSTIIGDSIFGDEFIGSSITGSTIIGNIIAGNEFIGSTICTDNIKVGTTLFSTNTDYTNTGLNAVSSILITIGNNLWKIPVQFVEAIPT